MKAYWAYSAKDWSNKLVIYEGRTGIYPHFLTIFWGATYRFQYTVWLKWIATLCSG